MRPHNIRSGSYSRRALFRFGNWCYEGEVDFGVDALHLGDVPDVLPALQKQQVRVHAPRMLLLLPLLLLLPSDGCGLAAHHLLPWLCLGISFRFVGQPGVHLGCLRGAVDVPLL